MPPRKFRPVQINTIGLIMLGVGALLTLMGLNYKTVVPTGLAATGPEHVHNYGLLVSKICMTMTGLAVSIIGTILYVAPQRRE